MKTTTIKKVAAFISALAMSAAIAVPVMRASAATVQIKDATHQKAGTSYAVYQIFSFTKTNNNTYEYAVNADWYPVITAAYTEISGEAALPAALPADYPTGDTAKIQALNEKLSDWIRGLEDTKLRALADYLANHTVGTPDTTAWTAMATGGVQRADLNDGYYLILDTNTTGAKSAPILISTNGDTPAEVTLKNDVPSLVKKIDKGNGELVDANTAGYNDVVDYQLTACIPDTQYYTHYTYVVTDTIAAGLDLDITTEDNSSIYNDYKKVTDGITVTVGENGCTTHADHAPQYAAYYNADARTLKIVFNSLYMQKLGDEWGHNGDDIVVTYSAKVNTDAVVGATGNANTAMLTFSSNPSQSGEGYKGDNDHDGDVDDADKPQDPATPEKPTTPGGPDDEDEIKDTEEDTVLTYTNEVEIDKIDQDNNVLTGAEFKIVKVTQDSDGTAIESPVDVIVVKDDTKTGTAGGTDGVKAYVGTDGKLTFSGLDVGTYRIYETDTPDGYNGLKGCIEFTLLCTTPEEVTAADNTAAWTLAYTGSDKNVTNSEFVFTVVNKEGNLFPSTGGMGTTILYIAGIAMLVGAGTLVVVKRKNK